MAGSLDIEDFDALRDYLCATGRIGTDERIQLSLLTGGVSNRTVLLKRESGDAWVLKQALEKLRVRVDWRSDPRRIEREALGMQRLAEIALSGAITDLIFLDAANHLLAMSAVPQPHENWKTMLLEGRLDERHVAQFAKLLAAIHRGGAQRQEQFAPEFADRKIFESLRLEPYYLYSAQRMPAVEDFYRELVDQCRATRWTLVHGDFSPKNVLVREGRLVLLDHEVIHFGDGAFDLGFALTHLLSKANFLAARRRDFADAAIRFWQLYKDELGTIDQAAALEQRACRHTLACLLARCIGRSPLEYLGPEAAARQANAASAMMQRPPTELRMLVNEFVSRIDEKSRR